MCFSSDPQAAPLRATLRAFPSLRSPMRSAWPALVLLALLGCPAVPDVVDLRPDTGQPPPTEDTDLAPAIRTSSDSLGFGEVAVGDTLAKTLIIDNIGASPLSLQGLEIDGGPGPFAWEQLEEVQLPAGGEARLDLTFSPSTHGSASATLIIHSDDPDDPSVSVELGGVGVAPELAVEPAEVLLGSAPIGCELEQRLVVHNRGNEAVSINAVDFQGSSAELLLELAELLNGPLPWNLPAEDAMDLGTVLYTPVDEEADSAYLVVLGSDERLAPLRVDVSGVGQSDAWVSDAWVVAHGVVDLIIALDSSPSMDEHGGGVLAGLPSLVEGLVSRGVDLQLAIVVDDDGCVNGDSPWIDGLAGEDGVYDSLVAMATHHGGTLLAERAFLLLRSTLEEAASGGCNEGLTRAGSGLHLLGISDEPEQSAGTWKEHLAALQVLHDDPAAVTLHAIAGDGSGCGQGAFGDFDEAVAATGGVALSLCSEDWAGDLDTLAAAVAAAAGAPAVEGPYTLSAQPVVASLTVRVDGATRSDGWSYDGIRNSVSFDAEHAPDPGSSVELRYAAQPEDCP
jgi:hypothetical protein